MALYVVHYHLLNAVNVKQFQFRLQPTEFVMMLHQGHYTVAVFIVLSGYCLMLPVLRDGGTLRGGMKTFFKRRARRILPPYYAALIGSGIVIYLVSLITERPVHELSSAPRWALHLLLVHNLFWNHIYTYNGALWSIATEWQIYFLFPLLFLPSWKRAGTGALLLVAGILAAALTAAFPSINRGCPWFIALFAMGMIAAKWSLQPKPWMKRVPWVWLGIGITVLTYVGVRTTPEFNWLHVNRIEGALGWYPLSDVLVGFATVCFLIHGTRATLDGRRSKMLRVLSWRPFVFIGTFSYSLYLIHMPLQSAFMKLLVLVANSRVTLYAAMLFIYIPIVVALAFGFYLVFEKPFIGSLKPKPRGEGKSA